MTTDRDERVERLRLAARRQHEAARERALHGLEPLVQRHEPVTVRAVARAGQVSIDFLYPGTGAADAHPSTQVHRRCGRDGAPATRSTVVHALARQLREVRDENADLRRRLEAAHGEIVRLKRAAGSSAARHVTEETHDRTT